MLSKVVLDVFLKKLLGKFLGEFAKSAFTVFFFFLVFVPEDMPFPMRIQPIDAIQHDAVKPPVLKSRLKRFFDRPLNGVMRISSVENPQVSGEEKEGSAGLDFEPSTVCLDRMVQNFMEDNDRQSATTSAKCCRHRCYCFQGNSFDDDQGFFSDSLPSVSPPRDPLHALKSLIPCVSEVERSVLADTWMIIEKNAKTCKRKDEMRKIVTDGLIALGYDASVCKSKWEKSSSIPAGEYEYIDVIADGDRLIIDVEFRPEFEIARSTSSYRSILQCLPPVFVGKPDRLLQIISIVAEAARESLRKKGMHVAPWREANYVKSKWLGPHARIPFKTEPGGAEVIEIPDSACGEFGSIFCSGLTTSPDSGLTPAGDMACHLRSVRPHSLGSKKKKAVVTGLASLLEQKV